MSGGGAPVALVSGASGGIGRAVVERLVRDGCRVVGVDRAAAPQGTGESVLSLELDVADEHACAAAVAQAHERFGRLDALVHCAGITRDAVAWKLSSEDWQAVLDVNLTSAFHLCRAAVTPLRAGGRGGSITLLSSINGERGKLGLCAYAASKAGLHGLAKSLARELGRFDVRVNVVAPGMIRTPMTDGLPDEIRDAARAETCLGRLGEPADVAAVVSFLCGADARHVTGQVLRVDGGQLT